MEAKLHTENRLSKMEEKIDNLKEDFAEVKKDIKNIAKDIKELDSKYSGKWVEKAIISIATGLIISILAGLFMFYVK